MAARAADRQAARWWRAAWPLLSLSALALLSVWPLLRAGYPTIGDGLNHFYRLVEFDHLLRQGVWFPRWAPDLAYGFGYPLFNYYPPLTYYAGALLHAFGLSVADSLLGVYVLAWLLALTGAYALMRLRRGPDAALLAAAAYGLAPYLYFNALARGALPETLGLGLLPWTLWAFGLLRLRNRPANLVLAAGFQAALLLTHFLTAFLTLPLTLLFYLWPEAFHRGGRGEHRTRGHERISWRSATVKPISRLSGPARGAERRSLPAATILAFSLAAYFLLPAVLETGLVQVNQLTLPGDLDFRNNFLPFAELWAWPRTFDARLVFRAVPPSLSLAALGLALLGLVAGWRGRRFARRQVALWAALALYAGLTLPVTRPLWELLPLAEIVQFPWRLVGPASLLLAILAGEWSTSPPHLADVEATASGDVRLRDLVSSPAVRTELGLLILLVFTFTWTFAPGFAAPAAATVADLARYERESGQLGTTSAGEFLPDTVEALPPPGALSAAYAQASVIPRLGTLPAGVSLQAQSATVTSAAADVAAAEPAVLTFSLLAFPGWRATIDGRPAAIIPSIPMGLITVPVPAGAHSVRVAFGLTPLRAAVSMLSALALAVLVILVALPFRGRRAASLPAHSSLPPVSDPRPPAAHLSPLTSHLPLTLTTLALLAFRATLLEARPSIFARSRFDGAGVAGVARPLDVNFDDQLVLVGADPSELSLAADGALPVTLYWRAQKVPATDYATTLQVWDDAGNLWAQSDSQHPGRLPTSRWRTDQYARDEHSLAMPLGTPPGAYHLRVGVYDPGGAALGVLDAARAPQGQLYPLGTLTVTPRRRPAARLDYPDQRALGPLTLLQTTSSAQAVPAGGTLVLDLVWQLTSAERPPASVRVELVTDEGEVIAAQTGPPARAGYPASAWQPGEPVRAYWRLRVPAAAPAGRLQAQVSVMADSSGAALAGPATIAAVDVAVPPRAFAPPAPQHPANAALGAAVTLLGYDLAPGGLTLYWRADAPMEVGYSAFVHVLGSDGSLMAQADRVPANGARPTTGWLPGEVIADTYDLPLAGAAALRVGLYDPATRERLGAVELPLAGAAP